MDTRVESCDQLTLIFSTEAASHPAKHGDCTEGMEMQHALRSILSETMQAQLLRTFGERKVDQTNRFHDWPKLRAFGNNYGKKEKRSDKVLGILDEK
ncbi:hypothetical protein PABG_11389 [Paracoccidioides brasiliensis Pb03]|nr:hypothetical protein PABG_11389 [Paracoccidioides brasiliensis Pb03]